MLLHLYLQLLLLYHAWRIQQSQQPFSVSEIFRIDVRASIIRGWEPTEIRRGKERERERAAAESPAESASALTAMH